VKEIHRERKDGAQVVSFCKTNEDKEVIKKQGIIIRLVHKGERQKNSARGRNHLLGTESDLKETD